MYVPACKGPCDQLDAQLRMSAVCRTPKTQINIQNVCPIIIGELLVSIEVCLHNRLGSLFEKREEGGGEGMRLVDR